MAKFKVGYIYEQAYSFTTEKGESKSGKTVRCIFHTLSDSGEIRRTYDYKVAPQFVPYLTVGECGSPAFDSFGRLADFFDN